MKVTIKYKLVTLILILIIPLFILAIHHYFEMLAHNKQLVNSRAEEIASAVALYLDRTIAESHHILSPIAKHPAVVTQNSAACNQLFADLLTAFADHLNILAVGMNGFNYGSGVDPSTARKLNFRDTDWFQRGSKGTPIVGDLQVSNVFKVPSVMMTVPIFAPDGRQTGVLGFPLNLVKVNEQLRRLWKLPPNSSIKVLDSRGNVLIDTLQPLNIGTHEAALHIIRDIAQRKPMSAEDTDQDGIARLFSYAPLARASWTVVVGIPSVEEYHAVNLFTRQYLTALLLVCCAATALAFFLIRRINFSVATLVGGLREIEKGNLSYRLPLIGNDELTTVATSFNLMTEERMKADAAIKDSENFLSSVLEGISEGVIVISRDHKIISANSSYCAQVKLPPEQVIGSFCHAVSHHLDNPCDETDSACICPMKHCFETGEHASTIHVHYDSANQPRSIEMHAYPLRNDAGEVVSVIATLKDVTHWVVLERSLEEAKEKYRKLYDDAPDMRHSLDADGRIVLCNATEATVLGYPKDEIIGREFTDFVDSEWREPCQQKFRELHTQGFVECEVLLKSKDGHLIPAVVKAKVIHDEQGQFKMAECTLRDITESKLSELKVRDAELAYRTLFEQSPEGIVIVEATTFMPLMFNDTACEQLGYSREEFTVMRITDHHTKDTPHDVDIHLARVTAERRDDFEIRLRTKSGEVRDILATAKKIELAGKGVIFCLFRDMTEIKKTEAALRENEKRLNHLAHHDPLTNLPNRILFYDRLQHALAQASRSSLQVAVLFLDLDRFKNINDTLGHKTGDHVLCKTAQMLKGLVRESDTVARLGGDEFLLILDGLEDLTFAGIVAQKLINSLSAAIFMEGQELYVTGSIGISIFPNDSDNVEGLMKCADVAMYRAKERGRNTYQFYTPDMNARAHELLRLENSLRKALENEELLLYYQPLIDIETGKLVGLEALVRWQHPKDGLILPGEFIHLAEETGLIVPIGEWVLRSACMQVKLWHDNGYPPVRVAVNISGRQFRHVDLVQVISQILADTGLDPSLLSLEITESVIMHEVESAIETLYELNRLGVQFAIDDFGTGYSSLGYLKRFPIAKLKIDRTFVRDVTTDPNDAAIVSSIIALGLGMNMEVIAEGVESEEQLRFLFEKGCKIGQGYLFSKPLPAEEIVHFLHGHA